MTAKEAIDTALGKSPSEAMRAQAETAKTNTVSVKVALATNAKKTWTLKQRLVVTALPAWAKGTYIGGWSVWKGVAASLVLPRLF